MSQYSFLLLTFINILLPFSSHAGGVRKCQAILYAFSSKFDRPAVGNLTETERKVMMVLGQGPNEFRSYLVIKEEAGLPTTVHVGMATERLEKLEYVTTQDDWDNLRSRRGSRRKMVKLTDAGIEALREWKHHVAVLPLKQSKSIQQILRLIQAKGYVSEWEVRELGQTGISQFYLSKLLNELVVEGLVLPNSGLAVEYCLSEEARAMLRAWEQGA